MAVLFFIGVTKTILQTLLFVLTIKTKRRKILNIFQCGVTYSPL